MRYKQTSYVMCEILIPCTGSRPASKFLDLEQMIVSYPQLCDPDYQVDVEKDWVGIDKKFKPVALP